MKGGHRNFGIGMTEADFYVNVCPGLGYVLTNVAKTVPVLEAHPNRWRYEGDTQIGYITPLAWLLRHQYAVLVRCHVPFFPGNKGEAGLAAERWFMAQHPVACVRKANKDDEYKDVDCYVGNTAYQVKLDSRIAETWNVFLETGKTTCNQWGDDETAYTT